jgi:hypothetical protein
MTGPARDRQPQAEPGPDESAAIVVLESSAVIKAFDRAMTCASAAGETSLALAWIRRLGRAVAPGDRRLLVGIALLVAPFVHVGLVMWHERPAGWQWLVLPGLSFAIGLVFLLFGASERRETG